MFQKNEKRNKTNCLSLLNKLKYLNHFFDFLGEINEVSFELPRTLGRGYQLPDKNWASAQNKRIKFV